MIPGSGSQEEGMGQPLLQSLEREPGPVDTSTADF